MRAGQVLSALPHLLSPCHVLAGNYLTGFQCVGHHESGAVMHRSQSHDPNLSTLRVPFSHPQMEPCSCRGDGKVGGGVTGLNPAPAPPAQTLKNSGVLSNLGRLVFPGAGLDFFLKLKNSFSYNNHSFSHFLSTC